MKRTLTALAVLASLAAGGASAFEINANSVELNSIEGAPMVSDLSVGVKAMILSWTGFCSEEGRLYLNTSLQLETDPSEYSSHYEIMRQPNGEFAMSYITSENKQLPPNQWMPCDLYERVNGDTTFSPVASINGFTDLRSYWADLVNQGYQR
jgi:hypothetical protein